MKNNLTIFQLNKNILLKKIPHITSIEGWLLLIEATTLYEIASNIKKDNPVICEIGVWKGKSSYVLASAIKDTTGKLYSIDPFNGEGGNVTKSFLCLKKKSRSMTLSKS
jgi:hypothetical protein